MTLMQGALTAALQWADSPDREHLVFGFKHLPGGLTGATRRAQPCRSGATRRRPAAFTQAQIKRAVKAVEHAGLSVKRVTIDPSSGAISIDSHDSQPIKSKDQLASWDDTS